MARLLHTSDWHLGRQIYRKSRDGDFDAVIAEIIDIARQAEPDLIVHSGDLFDALVPPIDEIVRALHALRELQAIAPVLVVAGNHDGARALGLLDKIENGFGADPRDARIRFVTEAGRGTGSVYQYPAGTGTQTIRVAAMPFLHRNRFRYDFNDPATAPADYAGRIRQVQADLHAALAEGHRPDRDVLVFAAHMFVEGAQPSYSERRIDITEDYASAADALPPVGYGALGHIHKPQAVGRAGFPARYAGSPLQLDFGETRDTKSVVVVEASPGRPTTIDTVPLTAGRRLVKVEGTLEAIAAGYGGVGDAWIKAVVHVDNAGTDLAGGLAKIFPQGHIVHIDEYNPSATAQILDRSGTAEELPGTEELFREYLGAAGIAGLAADHVMSSLADLLATPDPQDPGPFCEEQLLAAAITGGGIGGIDTAGLLVGATAHAAPAGDVEGQQR
jgi:exonuclease SbcD